MLRRWITEVRADLVGNIVQPGRFTAIEQGLAFYIRERRPNGLLVGLLMDDRRDPDAAHHHHCRAGRTGEERERQLSAFWKKAASSGTRAKQRDPNIVVFDRYAFDLSQFSSASQMVKYSVRERYLWQLIAPDTTDPQFKSSNRDNSAPNCMTACSGRSIRSHSC